MGEGKGGREVGRGCIGGKRPGSKYCAMAALVRCWLRPKVMMMSPPVYFLSYSRDNLKDVTIIAKTLGTYGIRTWQDLRDLGTGLSEIRIRNAIHRETSGLLFFSTKESVASEFVKEVELREGEIAHKANPDFHILPVFRLPISETNAALRGTLTVPISNFNGAKVDPTGDPGAIREAAHRAAELVLQRTTLEEQHPLPIGFTSKQSPVENVSLDIDFSPFFESGFPHNEEWNTDFLRALERVKDTLLSRSLTQLQLHTFAHLSLGLLFGFVFRERTGFLLEWSKQRVGRLRQYGLRRRKPRLMVCR